MRAIIHEQFGGAETLKLAELPRPAPGAGEILIRVAYASVNPVDWKIREGHLKDALPHRFPIIPGWDASGTVEETGPGVKAFRQGDAVYTYCRKPEVHAGTYAELVSVAESSVAFAPRNLPLREAAAIPLTALTAWQALFDFAKLEAGQTILIHAGAGGVGGMAIQLAKQAGARVLTTAGSANHGYVRELGADIAIDYHDEDIVLAVKRAAISGVDVVLDAVGGETQKLSMTLVKKGGALASIVGPPDEALAKKLGLRAAYVFVSPNGEELGEIGRLLEQGKLRAPQIEEMPLADAAKAQEKSRAGHTRGKIVLRVA